MKEPTICGCKSCNSKIFTVKSQETVKLPARKSIVITWSCLHGHLQQTEEQQLPDDWEDYVYPGGIYGL